MGVPVRGISGIQQDVLRVDVWWMGVLVCGISGIQQDVEWMFGGWGYRYVASAAYSRIEWMFGGWGYRYVASAAYSRT